MKKIDKLYNKYIQEKNKINLNRLKYEMVYISKIICKQISCKTKNYVSYKSLLAPCFNRFDKIINNYDKNYGTSLKTYTSKCLWNYLKSSQFHKSKKYKQHNINYLNIFEDNICYETKKFKPVEFEIFLKSILNKKDYKLLSLSIGLYRNKLTDKKIAKLLKKSRQKITDDLNKIRNKIRRYYF